MELSIIVPCYNEGSQIDKTMSTLLDMKLLPKDMIELVFVDDGSTDDTKEKLSKWFNAISLLKQFTMQIVSLHSNKGKGKAVRKGLLASSYNTKVVLDADLSVQPYRLREDYLFLKEVDDGMPKLIIGKRHQVKKQPFYRQIAGLGFRVLCRCVTGLPYQDTQCPYKIFYKFEREFFLSLKINGFAYDVEAIYLATKKGFFVYEVDAMYFNDSNSKVTLKKAIKMFFELIDIVK